MNHQNNKIIIIFILITKFILAYIPRNWKVLWTQIIYRHFIKQFMSIHLTITLNIHFKNPIQNVQISSLSSGEWQFKGEITISKPVDHCMRTHKTSINQNHSFRESTAYKILKPLAQVENKTQPNRNLPQEKKKKRKRDS